MKKYLINKHIIKISFLFFMCSAIFIQTIAIDGKINIAALLFILAASLSFLQERKNIRNEIRLKAAGIDPRLYIERDTNSIGARDAKEVPEGIFLEKNSQSLGELSQKIESNQKLQVLTHNK